MFGTSRPTHPSQHRPSICYIILHIAVYTPGSKPRYLHWYLRERSSLVPCTRCLIGLPVQRRTTRAPEARNRLLPLPQPRIPNRLVTMISPDIESDGGENTAVKVTNQGHPQLIRQRNRGWMRRPMKLNHVHCSCLWIGIKHPSSRENVRGVGVLATMERNVACIGLLLGLIPTQIQA